MEYTHASGCVGAPVNVNGRRVWNAKQLLQEQPHEDAVQVVDLRYLQPSERQAMVEYFQHKGLGDLQVLIIPSDNPGDFLLDVLPDGARTPAMCKFPALHTIINLSFVDLSHAHVEHVLHKHFSHYAELVRERPCVSHTYPCADLTIIGAESEVHVSWTQYTVRFSTAPCLRKVPLVVKAFLFAPAPVP
jgi:hypothetical protein